MRTVAKGDYYYYRIEGDDGRYAVTLYHGNRLHREVKRVHDTDVNLPKEDKAIWRREGLPSEEAARNAVLSQGLLLGLGADLPDHPPGNDDDTRD